MFQFRINKWKVRFDEHDTSLAILYFMGGMILAASPFMSVPSPLQLLLKIFGGLALAGSFSLDVLRLTRNSIRTYATPPHRTVVARIVRRSVYRAMRRVFMLVPLGVFLVSCIMTSYVLMTLLLVAGAPLAYSGDYILRMLGRRGFRGEEPRSWNISSRSFERIPPQWFPQ